MVDKSYGKEKYITTALDLSAHLIVSLILAVIFLKMTGGWLWPVLVVIGGILVDADHFIDYFLYYGVRFNLKDFFSHGYSASGKSYILFHSWELLIAVWVGTYFFSWLVPLAIGMTAHFIIDCVYSHRPHLLNMFLVYRWRHGFERAEARSKK